MAEPGRYACSICGAMVLDAVICTGCSRRLELALGDVPALVADLEITLARQAVVGEGGYRIGSRGTETTLPYHLAASRVTAALRATLCSWVLLCHDEHYGGTKPLPQDRTSAMAGWLLHEVAWLRLHEAASEAHHEILDAIANARRVVDRPAEKVFVGVCSHVERGIECTEQLYARRFADTVTCRICGTVHVVAERRKVLAVAVRDVLARPAEITRAVVWIGGHVRADQITRWVQGNRLVAKGHQIIGEKVIALYRIGDVLDLLHAMAEEDDATRVGA